MAGWTILRCWEYLAFHRKAAESTEHRQAIHKKFEEGRIQTESFHEGHDLFALKINDTIRAIGRLEQHQDQDCLVVLEVLPDHNYDRSNALKGKDYPKNSFTVMPVDSPEAKVGPSDTSTKSRIWTTCINKKVIQLASEQLEVIQANPKKPTLLHIDGIAGSGKTTLAELILCQSSQEKTVLYLTKSQKLIKRVKEECHSLLGDHLPPCAPSFKTYLTLCSPLIHKQLSDHLKKQSRSLSIPSLAEVTQALTTLTLHDDEGTPKEPDWMPDLKGCLMNEKTFITWVQQQHAFKDYIITAQRNRKNSAEPSRIGRELYEDIRKSHSTTGDLGKKESYGHKGYKDLLEAYKKYLHDNRRFDPALPDLQSGAKAQADPPYDLMVIDEAQDFVPAELKYALSFVKPNGPVYVFTDSLQSINDTFGLSSHYIRQLSVSRCYQRYQLPYTYRNPANISKVAQQILDHRLTLRGGKGSKDEPTEIQRVDTNDDQSRGYIGWITLANQLADPFSLLTDLKKEGQDSIELAIVVPDTAHKKEAAQLFSNDSILLTPEEIKGLEYKKIVLFNCFSAHEQRIRDISKHLNDPTQRRTTHHRPKDPDQAKGHGADLDFLTHLFITVTRTLDTLYFVETSNTWGLFEVLFKNITINEGEAIRLKESSLDDIIEKINPNVPEGLLKIYCNRAYSKIQQSIHMNKEDAQVVSTSLQKIISILQEKPECSALLQEARRLLEEATPAIVPVVHQATVDRNPPPVVPMLLNNTVLAGGGRRRLL